MNEWSLKNAPARVVHKSKSNITASSLNAVENFNFNIPLSMLILLRLKRSCQNVMQLHTFMSRCIAVGWKLWKHQALPTNMFVLIMHVSTWDTQCFNVLKPSTTFLYSKNKYLRCIRFSQPWFSVLPSGNQVSHQKPWDIQHLTHGDTKIPRAKS